MINNSLSTVSVNTTQYIDITYNVGSIEGTDILCMLPHID